MVTENFAQDERLDFDAHEFDGLREPLNEATETLVRRVDTLIREHPVACSCAALGLGVLLGWVGSRSRD